MEFRGCDSKNDGEMQSDHRQQGIWEQVGKGEVSQYKQLQNSSLSGLCLFSLRMRSGN